MKTVLARFDPASSTVAAISFTYKQRQQQLAANLARMDRFLQSFAQAVASQQEALTQTEVSHGKVDNNARQVDMFLSSKF